ncbi:tetratricopeptide repeat protein [Anaerolineales bacterium HSG6]|nr:tetratricopeptide repeat protein [Anaerolineales bacterium HSG6]
MIQKLADHSPNQDYAKIIKVLSSPESISKAIAKLDVADDNYIPRGTFYRKKEKALAEFSRLLLQHLKLPLRVEPPQAPPLFGRETLIMDCRAEIVADKKIGLYGISGVGKTALSGYLANSLAFPPFWFSFQLGLNDHLAGLLFVLGHFLQQQLTRHEKPSSSLFTMLMITDKDLKLELVLDMISQDLSHLTDNPPLFCFDEVDLLRPADLKNHAQIFTFLEEFAQLSSPMLFVGQHISLALDVYHLLEGLPNPAIQQLLTKHKISLSTSDMNRLQTFTQGNPRLLELFITLHEIDQPLTELLGSLTETPSVEVLLNRVWQRLDSDEAALLLLLSVIRRPIPLPDVQNLSSPNTVLSLLNRHLLQQSKHGALSLSQTFREIIYSQLPIEEKQLFHLKVAEIRAAYGEMTAASYHFHMGDKPELAVWLWYQHRQSEINQGQGTVALLLFEAIPLSRLTPKTQDALSIIRAELYKLVGSYDMVRHTLRGTFRGSRILKAQAKRLEGDVAELQSYYGRAIQAYQEGLETVEQLAYEKTIFHKNLSWGHLRERDLETAWYQAQLARYEAENMQGDIQMKRGNFSEAETYFSSALTLARSINYQEGIAKSCDGLGVLFGYMERFAEAETMLKEAETIFLKTGRLTKLANTYTNRTLHNLLAENFELVIELGQKALDLFIQLDETDGMTACRQNMSEAYFGLGRLDEAEQLAWQVIQAEEQEHLPDGLRVFGEVQFKRGNLSEARKYIQESINMAQQNQDQYLEAYGWRALGQVHQAAEKHHDAAQAFEQAVTLFEAIGVTSEVAKTLSLRDNVLP